VIPAGGLTEQAAITMDWTATILAAAQTKPDPNYPLDGIDLLPSSIHLHPPALTQRTLFLRTSIQDAVVKGRWKFVRDGSEEYLFDLSVDAREQANFRELNPTMFAQLRDEFKQWNSTVLPRPPARPR
jgi:arylsulfatase A-like enzyme